MEKQEKLDNLKEKMLGDKILPLQDEATNLVFGEGNPDATMMFIGEGPGRREDEKGIPFVGNAGALLNHLIEAASLKRTDIFITNVVHYRPPSNRDPEPAELAAFKPYLDKMIEVVSPEIIVTLGRFSMGKFLPGVKISSVHGKARKINWLGLPVTVVPMYHPAAGLRNGSIKQSLYNDFKILKDVIEDSNFEEEEEEPKAEQIKLI